MNFDVFIHHRMKIKNNEVDRWSMRTISAESEDQLFERIRELKIPGKFRVYPEEAGTLIRAHVVEIFETERLR